MALGCGRAPTPGNETSDTSSGEGSGSSTTSSTTSSTSGGESATSGESDESESESGQGSESDESSDSGDFVPNIDVGLPNSCSPMAQDCPEGEKCTSVACEVGSGSWDSNVCRPIQGTASPGDECMYTDGNGVSGNDTCGEGALCWNADADTGLGVCIAFCEGSQETPTCAAGFTCAILNDGALPICLPGCDPLAQDCSAANELCLPDPAGTGYICALDASGGMAPYGTPCEYANVCNPGLVCANSDTVPEPECAGAAGCCTPMCSISGGEACPGDGQTCEPMFDPQPPGFEDVGLCLVAM